MTDDVSVLVVGGASVPDLEADGDVRLRRCTAAADLEAVEMSPPDCAVCAADDVDVDPFGLVERIHDCAPELPVVLVATDHDPELAVRASRADGVEYLPDSVAAEGELRERVRTLADGRGRFAPADVLADLRRALAGGEASLDRLLAVGRGFLGTDVAFLSNVDRETGTYEVERAVGDGDLISAGTTDSLSNTYCRRAVDGDGLLGVRDTTADEGWTSDPAYRRYGFGCYLGARVEIDGELYGTLCFADDGPRDRQFADRERALVELFVELVAGELRRRRHEDELEAARADRRRTLSRIGDGFLSVDDDWVVDSANERARELLDRDRESLGGGQLWDVLPEATGEGFGEPLHRAARGEPVEFEARHGPLERWFEVRAYPDDDDGLSVFLRDVGERKRRERELRRSRERYRALAENVPNGAVVLVDDDRRFQVVRGGGLAGTGVDPEKLEGRRVSEALEELDELAVGLVDRTLDGESVRTELPLAGDDYQLQTAPVADDDGEVFAATAVITEVTAIRERERVVRELYEAIADPELSFDATVESLLSLGCDYLGTDYGTLSAIEGEEYRLEAVHAPTGTLEAGDMMPLSETNCQRAAATEKTVVLSDIESEAPELADRAGNVELGLRCYLGAPVFAGDDLHGTFCFYDGEPRAESFSEWERTLVDLMSQWVSYELERGDRERELERYESVLESIQDPIYAVDESLRFRLATDRLAGRLGYDREALSGRRVDDILEETTADDLASVAADIRETGGSAVFEGDCCTADGGRYPAEIEVSAPAGGAGFVGSMRDVTARKERERDLEFFYELVSAAGVGVVAVDERGRLEYLNDACAELLGGGGDPAPEAIDDLLADGAVADHGPMWEGTGFEGYASVWERVGFDETTTVEAVVGDDTGVPVELRLTKQRIDGEPYLFGTVVDVTERKETAEIRRTLADTAGRMLESDDRATTCRGALSAARTITGFPDGVVYRFDDDRGVLVPEAATEGLRDAAGGRLPTLSGGDSLAWQTFVDGQRRVVDDVATHERTYIDDLPYTAGLFVPLGEHGVLTLVAPDDRDVSERRREALDILAADVEGALDRTARERTLEGRERELEERTERLARLDRVNGVVRSVAAVVVRESDREGIRQAVAERLVGADPFAYAWVGADGPAGPTAEAWAGEPSAFDDPADVDDADHPASEAAATGEVAVVENLVGVADENRCVWQAAALKRGYPSCCAVPLTYEGTTRGVLTVYADRIGVFDDSLVELLSELGEMIGYALTAAERRAALESERTVELVFDVPEGTAFTRLADRLGCEVELKRVRTGGETTTVTYLLEGVDPDADVETALPGGTTATTSRLGGETALVEVTVGGEWIGSPFAAEGGRVTTATADPEGGELRARMPLGIEVRPVVESLRASYPGVEFVAKRERAERREPRSMLRGGVEERLTDRQLEVLETAYLAGFFDQPRTNSGDDVADLLGVSQPTFNQQRRAAERKLVEFLVEG